jgi:hypothetical protein
MRFLLLLLFLLPGAVFADPVSQCKTADGAVVIQHHPCGRPEKQHRAPAIAIPHHSLESDREVAVMCGYHRQLAEYFNSIARDAVSSSLGSAYSDQAQESEEYLRQHCQ